MTIGLGEQAGVAVGVHGGAVGVVAPAPVALISMTAHAIHIT